jgi:hypothetical protein
MQLRHSPIAHSAYHDLLRLLNDDRVSELRGMPSKVVRGNKTYWYDSYRVGSEVRNTYIGEDSAELRDLIKRHFTLREETEARSKERTRLIRILRAEGFMSVDASTGSLLSAMAATGLFRLGGTIIGTHAFRLYEGEPGVRYRFDEIAQTGDRDIVSFERLSLVLDDHVDPPIQNVLSDFAFEPAPTLDNAPAWRWRQSKGNALVEFLTPAFGEEGVRRLEALGVTAQASNYLNYLIAGPSQAAVMYRSGVLVQIPRPERFAIHKLIVSDRRQSRDRLKSEKDRRQAIFLIDSLLEDRPDDIRQAYQDAINQGPRWRERLTNALTRFPSHAERLR